MNDVMEPLVQFSPFAGQLKELTVPGETSREVEHENDVYAADGAERTMLCYAPRSGCPDAKQNQVLFVLRQDAGGESAQELMERLGLDALAEQEHFLLIFPNPTAQGWNYREELGRDNDIDYLIRCFGMLRGSELKVNGFVLILLFCLLTSASATLTGASIGSVFVFAPIGIATCQSLGINPIPMAAAVVASGWGGGFLPIDGLPAMILGMGNYKLKQFLIYSVPMYLIQILVLAVGAVIAFGL